MHTLPQIVREAEGEKYRAAVKWQLHVVSPEWATTSVERGFMVDPVQYIVGDPCTSLAGGNLTRLNSSVSSVASTIGSR